MQSALRNMQQEGWVELLWQQQGYLKSTGATWLWRMEVLLTQGREGALHTENWMMGVAEKKDLEQPPGTSIQGVSHGLHESCP